MIRYRRNINDVLCVAEYQEETWEETWENKHKCLRFISADTNTWYGPLEDHEKRCILEGWEPPDRHTYVDKLPADVKQRPCMIVAHL